MDSEIAQLRLPPHSIEAEQSVLGGLLLNNGTWEDIADIITDDDTLIFWIKSNLLDFLIPIWLGLSPCTSFTCYNKSDLVILIFSNVGTIDVRRLSYSSVLT